MLVYLISPFSDQNEVQEVDSWEDLLPAQILSDYGFLMTKFTGDFDTDFKHLINIYNGLGHSKRIFVMEDQNNITNK